ncbi:hypothetical protein AK830_g916 [Neonectria ditissima]|uniref:Aminoglycoside phosphotransferase domain-containing protein n=1 Tax=Neonectria ditissima TaxID=78410 RepID=A0A0P7B6S9_9HYPO|nr:hypothetical protein AK830_g916 [Neonectria ditissima]
MDAASDQELSSDGVTKEFFSALKRRINASESLHELFSTRVVDLGSDIALKYSLCMDLDDVFNLQYLRSRLPGIPSPDTLGAFRSGRMTYFFMSRAPGVTLESIWPDLTQSDKLSIQKQLNVIFQTLRAVDPRTLDDGFRLGSFTTGICKDTRRQQRVSDELIQTEAQFNAFLFRAPNRTTPLLIKMLRSSMREDHRMVMTHGDLSPRNIMVTGNRL